MAKKKTVKKEKVFTGDAWSTDDNQQFYYKVVVTKEDAIKIIKLMDIYKALTIAHADIEFHELTAFDNCGQIYNDEDMKDKDEQLCDYCKVRVMSNGCLWELKDKYCTNVYETMDVMRSDLEELIKEGE